MHQSLYHLSSIHLYIYPSIHLVIYPSIIYPSVIHPSIIYSSIIYTSIHLSIIYPSILYPSIIYHLSIYHLSIYNLSIYPSILYHLSPGTVNIIKGFQKGASVRSFKRTFIQCYYFSFQPTPTCRPLLPYLHGPSIPSTALPASKWAFHNPPMS